MSHLELEYFPIIMDGVLLTTYKMGLTFSVIISFANVVEIALLLTTRKRWDDIKILLLGLAFTDAALLVTTTCTIAFSVSLPREQNTSKIQRPALSGNMCGSLFIVPLISIDRYGAVRCPLKYHVFVTRRKLYIGIPFS